MSTYDDGKSAEELFQEALTLINKHIKPVTDAEKDAAWSWLLSGDPIASAIIALITDIAEMDQNKADLVIDHIGDKFKHHLKGKVVKRLTAFVEHELEFRAHKRAQAIYDKVFDDDFDPKTLTKTKLGYPCTVKNLTYTLQHLSDFKLQFDKLTRSYRLVWPPKPLWPIGDYNEVEAVIDLTPGPQSVGFVDDNPRQEPQKYVLFDQYHQSQLQGFLNGNIFPIEQRWNGFRNTCYAMAKADTIDLYQLWLRQTTPQWDGVKRLDDWLEVVFKADASTDDLRKWNAICGRAIFVGMVMRCLYPGTHFRIVVVLEGSQDIGKTWLVKKLAFHPSRYLAIDFAANDVTESRRAVKGMTVIEFAELASFDKINQALLKRFISEETDRTRTLYTEDYDASWRRGIIVGTYNPAKYGEVGYMADMSGDTRFARVRSKAKILVDHSSFDAILPQLWAEALHLVEKENVRGWLSDADKVLQEKMNAPGRRKSFGYDFVHEFLETNCKSMGSGGATSHGNLKLLKRRMLETGITVEDIISWARSDSRIPRDRTNVGFHSQVIQAVHELGFRTVKRSNLMGRALPHTFIFPVDAREFMANEMGYDDQKLQRSLDEIQGESDD